MINKQVLEQLRTKLKVGTRRVHRAVKEKKAEYHNLITREIAAYILAADSGIDVAKYLEKDELSEVLEARKGHSSAVAPSKIVRGAKPVTTKIITVNIGQKVKFGNGFLTEKDAKDAKEMAEEVYPLVYLFENSIRKMIAKLMQDAHGTEWWNNKVGGKIRRMVDSRMASENANRWHSKRGADPIFYTDMGDLSSIITENWDTFKSVFPDQGWITQRFTEIELSRNIIAHNNLLEEREINRIKLYFEDWNKQLSKLPDATGTT